MGKNHPDFSGFMHYETDIEILEPGESQTLIHLEDAYEGVEVWIYDQYVGMKICPPYTLDKWYYRESMHSYKTIIKKGG